MDDFFIDVLYNKTGTISKVSFSDEDILHYGRKGMRWGVRNRSKAEDKARAKQFGPKGKSANGADKQPTDTGKPKGSKRMAPDAAQAARLKTKDLSQLNNEQIAALTKRMQLEKSYKELMAEPKAPSKMDQRFAKLDNANKKAASVAKTLEIGAKFVKFANSDAGKMVAGAVATTATGAIASGLAKNGTKKVSKVAASNAGKAAARRAAQMAAP